MAANLLATGQNGHFVPLLQDRGPAGIIARSLIPAAMILPVLNTVYKMADHESARTTGLYDRRGDEISLDEVERIGI